MCIYRSNIESYVIFKYMFFKRIYSIGRDLGMNVLGQKVRKMSFWIFEIFGLD